MAQGRAVTGEQVEKMLAALRLGMTRRAAAAAAGYSKSTFYRMIEHDDGTLRTAIENAEGEAEATYSALVAKAAAEPKNWTAAAWWLERRHPDDYGRRDRVDVTLNIEQLAAAIATDIDPAELVAEAERIMRGGE